MRHRGRDRMTRALASRMEHAHAYYGDGDGELATVTGLSPLTAELVLGGHVLTEDKLNPCKAVTGDTSLAVGDALVLVRVRGDEFSAVGVIAADSTPVGP